MNLYEANNCWISNKCAPRDLFVEIKNRYELYVRCTKFSWIYVLGHIYSFLGCNQTAKEHEVPAYLQSSFYIEKQPYIRQLLRLFCSDSVASNVVVFSPPNLLLSLINHICSR
jgi:hypothetical protein